MNQANEQFMNNSGLEILREEYGRVLHRLEELEEKFEQFENDPSAVDGLLNEHKYLGRREETLSKMIANGSNQKDTNSSTDDMHTANKTLTSMQTRTRRKRKSTQMLKHDAALLSIQRLW